MTRKEKTAPRESRRRRRKVNAFQKIVMAAFVIIVIFSATWVIRKAVRAGGLFFSERSAVHRLEKDFAAKKNKNKLLSERRKYLKSKSGALTEARKLGYVRPGEVSVMIDNEESKNSKKPEDRSH